jgi:NAD(P)-dependent dehydrogenase (short-subunit alcohol dehydrogenase family)
MKKLEGKVAVITGGSSGIGLATAKRFVDEGAHVVITGRREKELKEAGASIKRNVTTVVGDVSRLEDLDRDPWIKGATDRFAYRFVKP